MKKHRDPPNREATPDGSLTTLSIVWEPYLEGAADFWFYLQEKPQIQDGSGQCNTYSISICALMLLALEGLLLRWWINTLMPAASRFDFSVAISNLPGVPISDVSARELEDFRDSLIHGHLVEEKLRWNSNGVIQVESRSLHSASGKEAYAKGRFSKRTGKSAALGLSQVPRSVAREDCRIVFRAFRQAMNVLSTEGVPGLDRCSIHPHRKNITVYVEQWLAEF